MDKKNAKQLPLPPLNDTQINLFKRLTDYEQNIIQYLRAQTSMIKNIQESINSKSERLKLLESEFSNHYEQIELIEIYKTNMQKRISTLQAVCQDINQATHDTFTTLIKIDNLAFTNEHKIKQKQAKLREEKSILENESQIIEQELNLLQISEAVEQKEYELSISTTKSDINTNNKDREIEEKEIAGLTYKEKEKDELLERETIYLTNYEKSIIIVKKKIEEADVKTVEFKKNVNELELVLNDINFKLDDSIKADLNTKKSIRLLKCEISAIEEENLQLEDDESFQSLINEKRSHDIQVKNLEECLKNLKETYSHLESDVSKEEAVRESIQEEHVRLNSQIDNGREILNKVSNQIELLNNKDKSQIAKCKVESKAAFDEILLKTTSINELKRQVADLEHSLDTIPVINEDEIPFVTEKIVDLKKSIEHKVIQIDTEFQELTSNQDCLKENRKKEVIEQLDMIQNLTDHLNIKIEEVLKEERTANITYQANLVECDVFAKKLKDKMTTRHNLKKQIASFKQPSVPVRKRRGVDEFSEASDTAYENFTNILDIQKYMMAKRAKKST